jgi:uncharacterized membrane protein YfbV (UPF0208 family)
MCRRLCTVNGARRQDESRSMRVIPFTASIAVLTQVLGSRTEIGPLWLRITVVVAVVILALTLWLLDVVEYRALRRVRR